MSDPIQDRRKKLDALREGGIDPYPPSLPEGFPARQSIEPVRVLADQDPPAQPTVCGRLVRRRDFGKMLFADLMDQSGVLQVMVQKGEAPELHDLLRNRLDEGDFVAVHGTMGRSKKGEPTLFAAAGALLSKSLLPPPEKWHGLTNVDLRTRLRYVDLFSNPEVRRNFERRSKIVQGMRSHLQARGFLEVETPLLHPLAGGAAARPFVTHHNALDLDLYLRIAPELYLKRLLVGGFEKVFEIGRVFRNEGLSPRHNPEFTMMELYWAYVDYESVLALTEELIRELAREHCEGGAVTLGERRIELDRPFARRPYLGLVEQYAGIDPRDPNAVRAKAAELHLDVAQATPSKVLDEVFEATVLPHLDQPTFVVHYPTELCPLAKKNPSDPAICDRFELFINGWEVANAFSELNDPLDQRARFEEQVASRDPESPAAVDEDYLRALEYGMPNAAGLGIGVDRLVMVLTGSLSIRETILFPTLRPESGEVAPEAAGEN